MPHLRGMFSFAIWDEEKQGILLAYDHFGIKPLYYYDDGQTFRFASQVKALLAGGGIPRQLEPAALVGFYLWGCVPEPFTMTKGLRSLSAGHTQWIDGRGAAAPKSFFDLQTDLNATGGSSDAAWQVEERLRHSLADSVQHHLLADVLVSVLLSAGVDSPILAALAIEEKTTGGPRHGQRSVNAVRLRFDEYTGTEQYEVTLARQTSQYYGLKHHVSMISEADFHSDYAPIIAAMDLPAIDGVNTWFVSRPAAEAGYKVAISGLGADEILGGYPSFVDVPTTMKCAGSLPKVPLLGR